MDPQEDKNKQNKAPEDIKALEKEMKTDFKEGRFDAVKTLYDRIMKLDPENRLAPKLKEKAGREAKAQKAGEYVDMLKKLYKEKDTGKLTALAKEFKEYDPENKQAVKWEQRAAKLHEKLTGMPQDVKAKEITPPKPGEKKEETPEKKVEPAKIEIKAEPVMKPAPAAPVRPMGTPQQAPAAPIAPKPASIPMTATSKMSEAPKPPAESAPAMPKPVTPPAAMTPAPVPAPKVPAATAREEKGNLFTRMFGKKEEEIQKKSIIDTIVAKSEKKEAPKVTPAPAPLVVPKIEKPAEEKEMAGLLTFSKIFLNFAIVFIVLSAAFFYVEWIDKNNTVLALAGISENTGGRLHAAATTLEKKQEEEKELNKDIKLYEEGYDDRAVETIYKIISERINWPDIFARINEVTNFVYEHNNFFKYIEYNNYSFDARDNSIRVSGTLSDPLGRNLTKLVELEEAFKYYPKDKNDPEDTTEPYFTGFKEFTSFSKSLDKETGRYNSSFQLSFTLNK